MICAIMEKSRKHTMQDPQNNTEKKEKSGVRTAGAISFVFLLTLFAKLLGVVREMMQANIFGTGIDADLYTASYNSTLYLFTTMCYALCIAAVPILTKEFAADRKRGEKAANNLLTITLLARSRRSFCGRSLPRHRLSARSGTLTQPSCRALRAISASWPARCRSWRRRI